MIDDPHRFPEGDYFEHDYSPYCPCQPKHATVSVARRGYTMRWHHQLVQPHPTPLALPDGFS